MKKYSPELKERARKYFLEGLSPKAIAKMCDIPRANTVREWARRENWQAERDRIVQQGRRQLVRRAADAIADMQEQHIRYASTASSAAFRSLFVEDEQGHTVIRRFDDPLDAVRALQIGMKEERLARGEPTERIEVFERLLALAGRMSDEDALRIIEDPEAGEETQQ
jgi:transposase-like protein